MEVKLALIVGILYAAGIYLMLNRSFVRLIIGIVVLGHATNLFLFVISRLTRGEPAMVAEGAQQPDAPFADHVPQALILTAIVIGFGIQAFAIILLKRVYQTVRTSDLDDLDDTDKLDPKA
jgi:multicomponent Na+:H+ antiporter subunit C